MNVTFKFYDASCMNVFRESSYCNMHDLSLKFVNEVVERSIGAFMLPCTLSFIVSRQFVGLGVDDDYIFNIIFDGSLIPDSFGDAVLDDIAFTVDRVIVCHSL